MKAPVAAPCAAACHAGCFERKIYVPGAYHPGRKENRIVQAGPGSLLRSMKKQIEIFNSSACNRSDPEPATAAAVKLDEEYRLTRQALLNAGVEMTDSIDALYRDWRRWRGSSKSRAGANRDGLTDPDQWWARHLAQFRVLIDQPHIAARAERARKDRNAARAKTRCATGNAAEPLS